MTTLPAITEPQRGRFEGLLQMLRFNRPMFITAALCLAAGSLAPLCLPLPAPIRWGIIAFSALAAWWIAAALAVSHWVYDHHPTFQFQWLAPWIAKPGTWLNVHAGFDQTSLMLRGKFPDARLIPLDFFDPVVMTERSIHRARSYYPQVPGTLRSGYDRWPVAGDSADAAFMLFAAHELRTAAQRAVLFRQAAHALKPGGVLVVLEHLRGTANFLAFGPGAFHFHSRRQWLRAGAAARLALPAEIAMTPFARAFVWRKS
jgi:SAM-dependent methyltransferase